DKLVTGVQTCALPILVVKAEWDAEVRQGQRVRALLLGSSALLLGRGTSESLAGRFFLHRCPHWSFPECRDAFGWDLERWLFFGEIGRASCRERVWVVE